MLSDYLFTPKDFWNLGANAINKFRAKDLLGLIILFLAFELFWWFLSVSPEALFFIFFIVALFYWKIDARVSISLALASLLAVVILLVLAKFDIIPLGDEAANQVAVWAFYFLSIGVIKQIWEHWNSSTEYPVPRDEEVSNEYRSMSDEEKSTGEKVPRDERIVLKKRIFERRKQIRQRRLDL